MPTCCSRYCSRSLRQRDVTADERPVQPAHVADTCGLAVEIPHVPAMLAVHAHRARRRPMPARRPRARRDCACARSPGRVPEQTVQARIVAHEMARALLAERDAPHVGRVDALRELGRTSVNATTACRQRRARHAVDQVDDPVFEPADAEAVNHVDDQRAEARHAASIVRRQCADAPAWPRSRASAASIDGVISAANSLNVAAAFAGSIVVGRADNDRTPRVAVAQQLRWQVAASPGTGWSARCPDMQNHSHTSRRCARPSDSCVCRMLSGSSPRFSIRRARRRWTRPDASAPP